MAEITAFPQVIGTSAIADADKVSENLYAPKATPDTFDVLNGWLDRENLPGIAPWQIDASQIRPGAYTRPYSVGATANLDLFYDFFRGHSSSYESTLSNYRPISGAGATCYIPWDSARVIVRWHVAIATDGTGTDAPSVSGSSLTATDTSVPPPDRGAVILKHTDPDGGQTGIWSTHRWFLPAGWGFPGKPASSARRGDLYDRMYTGHRVFTGLSQGYHHFNLCGWMSGPKTTSDTTEKFYTYLDGMRQMRFRTRGFRALVLRG